ncbi:TrmH family RNA methyltransferase [Desulfogranum mediterraneum]|uniref:TrmH family RNA methyltransferase n=1 Tax=Desulfogranum mediterraneum TaxID=160661 RepID=UPI000425FD63|nr:TrmH family RNA methyltransferase [Desulfogranum mediterraneum]
MRSRFNRRQDMATRFTKAKRKNLIYAQPGPHECVVILDGLKPDFNIGKIIRSADAFGIREVHLTGVDFFDPEPAKGSMRWVVVRQHQDFAGCYRALEDQGFTFLCLEPGGEQLLGSGELPLKTAFVVGHEEFGLSFQVDDYPAFQRLTIPQWGKVQSLNVSVAASLAMYEYVRQHGRAEQARTGQLAEQLLNQG